MGDKVALPSLSLPKQRTHWSVFVVIAASVLFLIMCGALYLVLQRQEAAEEAFAKRQADHQAEFRAKADAERAGAERAVAEAKKKEAETAAAAAAAAAEKKKAQAAAAAADEAAARKKGVKKGPKAAKAGATAAATPGTPAATPTPEKPRSKESKSIDDLLKSFK